MSRATPWELLSLAIWAATIPLMPYALLRRRHDALAACAVIFLMLLIDVFIMLNRPNPDHVIFIQVVE
jgi:sterol desaturase/sphingolipid hydroxylase (fatty acid hydroxylase superfamily)